MPDINEEELKRVSERKSSVCGYAFIYTDHNVRDKMEIANDQISAAIVSHSNMVIIMIIIDFFWVCVCVFVYGLPIFSHNLIEMLYFQYGMCQYILDVKQFFFINNTHTKTVSFCYHHPVPSSFFDLF